MDFCCLFCKTNCFFGQSKTKQRLNHPQIWAFNVIMGADTHHGDNLSSKNDRVFEQLLVSTGYA